MSGKLEAIFACATLGAMPGSLSCVEVCATGIHGDRYHAGIGTFSKSNLSDGRAISPIAAEVVDELPQFANGLHRRNLVVRGVDLDALRGHRFRIGAVELFGVRGCPPCGYLSRVAGVDAKTLLHRKGGLRCDVLLPGTIRVGDPVDVG